MCQCKPMLVLSAFNKQLFRYFFKGMACLVMTPCRRKSSASFYFLLLPFFQVKINISGMLHSLKHWPEIVLDAVIILTNREYPTCFFTSSNILSWFRMWLHCACVQMLRYFTWKKINTLFICHLNQCPHKVQI